jgi:hypothetical protein
MGIRWRAAFWVGIGFAAFGLSAACGGGTTAPPHDAGPGSEGGTGVDATTGPTPSGTTGQLCDAGCAGANTTGSGNVCSSTVTLKFDGGSLQVLPTPVCIEPQSVLGNCDPAPLATDPNGIRLHFCDGPDDPSSPGICVPFNPANPQTGLGTCYPKCQFETDGAPATGCQGVDTCTFLGYRFAPPDGGTGGCDVADPSCIALGVGYCQGTCQSNADCGEDAGDAAAGCQVDLGFCTTKIVDRTKQVGDPCTTADSQSGACNCFAGATGNGFCSSRCVVGGTPCPLGWVCDPGEPEFASISGLPGFDGGGVTPTQGMAGMCAPACSAGMDGGIGPDASAHPDGGGSGISDGAADAADAESDATVGDDASAPADATATDDAGAPADASVSGDAGDAAFVSDAGALDGSGDGGDGAVELDAGVPADGGEAGAGPTGVCPPNSTCVTRGAVGADCLPR